MTAVLFLDVDGVLNSARWLRAGHMKQAPNAEHFDPAACARLERIIAATGCDLVLSSSWRIIATTQEIAEILHARGCPSARFLGDTPHWRTVTSGAIVGAHDRRGSEIQEWLDAHPEHRPFVILDDSDDMGPLLPRLVRTTWEDGLQDREVREAIGMLGAPEYWG